VYSVGADIAVFSLSTTSSTLSSMMIVAATGAVAGAAVA
jgi:hypothetical protein